MSETEGPPTKVKKVEFLLEELEKDNGDEDHEDSQEDGTEDSQEDGFEDGQGDGREDGHGDGREDGQGEGQEEWLSEGILTDDEIHNNSTVQEQSNSDLQIEQTLDNFEKSSAEIPDELGDFLVRKPDADKTRDRESSTKQSDDDGNDTDDLLRMLEDGDKNKKKQVFKSIKERSKTRSERSVSSDDDFDLKVAQVKKIPVTKTVRLKQATRATPEHMTSDCESSEEEEETVKKMFGSNLSSQKNQRMQQQIINANKHTYIKKIVPVRTVKKNDQKPKMKLLANTNKQQIKSTNNEIAKQKVVEDKKEELDEIIDEAEFLEEEDFDLDDTFVHRSKDVPEVKKHRILRPEQMDEDVPSDNETASEPDSMFDEFPTSASDDEFENWFQLDIRAETAGDFLPLLGPKAYKLLTEEKFRVSSRVASLKENITALAGSSKRQTEELNKATLVLADLDAMLAAS